MKFKPNRKSKSFSQTKKNLFEKCKYTCSICGTSIFEEIQKIENAPKPEAITTNEYKEFHDNRSKILGKIQVHHIVPLSKEGNNHKANLIVLCYECHKKINEFERDIYIDSLNRDISNLDTNKDGNINSYKKSIVLYFGNMFGNFNRASKKR